MIIVNCCMCNTICKNLLWEFIDGGTGVHYRSYSVHVRHHSSPGSSVYNTDSFVRIDSLHFPNQARLLISRIRVRVSLVLIISSNSTIAYSSLDFTDCLLDSGVSYLEG